MKPQPKKDGKRRSGGLLLPGAPLTALTYLGSECVSLAAVVVRTYQRPDDGGTMPGKSGPFTTRVEPVSPPCRPTTGEREWWRRRALPPGPQRLCRAAFITIAAEAAGNR